MHSKNQTSHSKVCHLNWQNDRLLAGSQPVCNIWCSHYVATVGMTNTNQTTAVTLLQLLQSCMSQAGFELWIGRRGGALNTRLPVSYFLHKAKRSLASFEVLAITRVEDASNLAMETAWYTETSVECHRATRRRMPDDGILTVDLFPVPYAPFLLVVLLHVFTSFHLVSSASYTMGTGSSRG
jgi:hypothetical protein